MSLEDLEQKLNTEGFVKFKEEDSSYNNRRIIDRVTIDLVTRELEKNSSSILSIGLSSKGVCFGGSAVINLLSSSKQLVDTLKILKNNTHLLTLHLSDYEINEAEAEELRELLINHPSLTDLHLYYMTFKTPQAAALFAEGIEKNKNITEVHFTNVTFHDEGIQKIESAFKNNHILLNLDIQNGLFEVTSTNKIKHPVSKKIIESIEWSTSRNWFFYRTHALVEEGLLIAENLNIIPKDFNTEKSIFMSRHRYRISYVINQYKEIAKKINQGSDEEKAKITLLALERTLDIVDTLKEKGYAEWPHLLKRVKRVVASVYLDFQDIESFVDLYLNYSMFNESTQFDFSFAREILMCDENNKKGKFLLASLRLSNLNVRRQYLLNLLKNPDTPEAKKIYQTAYCNVYDLSDPFSSGISFEKTIGVDTILMHSDLDRLSRVLNSLAATTTPTQKGIDGEDSEEETEFDVDSEQEERRRREYFI